RVGMAAKGQDAAGRNSGSICHGLTNCGTLLVWQETRVKIEKGELQVSVCEDQRRGPQIHVEASPRTCLAATHIPLGMRSGGLIVVRARPASRAIIPPRRAPCPASCRHEILPQYTAVAARR